MAARRHRGSNRSASDYRVETLEPRVLFSADAALVVIPDVDHPPEQVSMVDGGATAPDVVEEDGSTQLEGSNELIIIDSATPDLDELLRDFANRDEPTRVVVLEAGDDPLGRLAKLIEQERGLTALHLISHGADGELQLGGERIDTLDLLAHADDIIAWQGAFAGGADVLIYGCDVAASGEGRNFIDTLSRLSGTDVAASIDVTGPTRLGGDWQLEYAHGDVTRGVLVGEELQESYDSTLLTYTVTNFGDSGAGSLREAIVQANDNVGFNIDVIRFNGPGTIQLTNELPAISRQVTIDATVGTGYAGTPLVVLDGSLMSDASIDGLTLASGSDDSTVRGLAIVNFPGSGISIANSDSHVIESNHIGTDGVNNLGNANGIYLTQSSDNSIGGLNGTGKNVISGNDNSGVWFASGAQFSTLQSNYIGTNASGTTAIANGYAGVQITDGANVLDIGGVGTTSGNLISGNDVYGVLLNGAGVDNFISGNIIGLASDGSTSLGNQDYGVQIANTAQSLVGSDGSGDYVGNVVSGNQQYGVSILGVSSTDNYVSDNHIGTDVDGTAAAANGTSGILLASGANNNDIGEAGLGNVISGNGGTAGFGMGVYVTGAGVDDNRITANYIGLDRTGLAVLGNANDGIRIDSGASGTYVDSNIVSGNGDDGIDVRDANSDATVIVGNYIGTDRNGVDSSGIRAFGNGDDGITVYVGPNGTIIGDTASGQGNIISGNAENGIYIAGATSTLVRGNSVGIDLTGAVLGNSLNGINVDLGSTGTVIGDSNVGGRNTVSGNDENGIHLQGAGTSTNSIVGNYIGTDTSGQSAIGNGADGILISDQAQDNTVGGSNAALGNVISGNGFNSSGDGISINGFGTDSNIVIGNRIGTDADGTDALANAANGVEISDGAKNSEVGGNRLSGEGNQISGNTDHGIYLNADGTDDTVISGNLIGTNATGTQALGNGGDGIFIWDAPERTLIGGATDGYENLISGNGDSGIELSSEGTDDTRIYGNYIGTNLAGSAAVANARTGIIIYNGVERTLIGGGAAGEGNLISGNGAGILINGNNAAFTHDNIISGNRIGTDATGENAVANTDDGINIQGWATGTVIGGTASGDANLISGNTGHGVQVSDAGTNGTSILGNRIGTNADGDTSVANLESGVAITNGASSNSVGGNSSAGEGNLISGNGQDGIFLTGSGTDNNVIQGNLVGTDAAGLSPLGNGDNGILVNAGASGNFIGGDATLGQGNVVSANIDDGIEIRDSTTDNNTITGNFVGTDKNGEDAGGIRALANGDDGIQVYGSVNGTIIGGASAGLRNVVSGNDDAGISISGAIGTIVLGNYIGLDANGFALGNDNSGIAIKEGATATTIGGSTAAEANIISANGSHGVQISTNTTIGTVVSGNVIGLDSGGTLDRGNSGDGVNIDDAPGVRIGGGLIGERNIISANGSDGIQVSGTGASGTTILGNRIGTSADGSAGLGNSLAGIRIENGATATRVGDSGTDEGNLISGNGQQGIVVDGFDGTDTTGNIVQGNRIGTNADGTAAIANGSNGTAATANGIEIIRGALATQIGGDADSGEGNLVSGHAIGVGVLISGADATGTTVLGNFIGTTVDGNGAFGNLTGIKVNGTVGTVIGGTGSGDGNLLSGNLEDGIHVLGASTTGIMIVGNRVGTTANGFGANANQRHGIFVASGTTIMIGGTATNAGNLVSANGVHGISISGSNEVRVLGNFVGTDATGNNGLGNAGAGVTVTGVSDDVVIGSVGGGNVIADNGQDGVFVDSGVSNASVVGNIIGLAQDGNTPLGNVSYGVRLAATGVVVGGTTVGAGNVISDNVNGGILLESGSDGTRVLGNLIGLDASGAFGRGNHGDGLTVESDGNFIGEAGSGNTIADNANKGISVQGASGNTIVGNRIGTALDGTTDIGNQESGILFQTGSSNNLVGGPLAAEANTISANVGIGIAVDDSLSTGNTFQGNVITANGGLAIDLGASGINANDADDIDAGANDLQNAAVISRAGTDEAGSVEIVGTIDSTPSTDFRIDFYAAATSGLTGNGVAERYLGSAVSTTDAAGDASFVHALATSLSEGEYVSATVTHLDSGGDAGSTSEFSAAVIAIEANVAPVFTSGNFISDENTTLVGTVVATDGNADALNYSIFGGVDAALFSIDGVTGELTFISAPDHETPGDAGGDNIYDVIVEAADGNGGTATQAIAVTVNNVNEDPVITSASAINAAEDQTTVLTVTSTDVDGGAPAYSITGGADAALFAIDGSSGDLAFLAAPDFESPTDVGDDNVYDVIVEADDGLGGTAIQAIAVTVANVNEDPTITSASAINAAENQSTVLIVTSNDVDGGAPTYSISGGADAALFAIDSSSGALTFLAAPDHESPTDLSGDNVYDVIVEADDGLGGTAAQAIAVTVTNVNEDPTITSAGTASVSENQTSVLTVTSSDVDGGTPTYSISGGVDAALFAIDGSSGELTFLAAPDFESPTDVGGDNVYDVIVEADDGLGGTAAQAIAVTVTNVNEDPVISSSSVANAAENQTSVLTVTSSDVDGAASIYTISGGADAALFAIDGSSGALTFLAAPDFESPTDVGGDNVYDVVVEADDGLGGTATQAIAVTVTNVNEDPTITSASATNAAENQTTVLTVTSSDVDGGAPTYSIAGGADAALFAIDGSSGELTFDAARDFESALDVGGDNVYDVIVEADDGLGGTAAQAIAVTVTNVNEDPTITSAGTASVSENQTSVLTVTSSDVDGGTPTYSISGGVDAALFAIDGSSGELAFLAAPDFESPIDAGGDNVFNVIVEADDGLGGTATQAIAVTVTNVNEDPTVTSASAINAAEDQTTVLTVTSTDVDGGAPAYSITGGADAALFAIDGSSGELTFDAAPDFESALDVGGDNVYDVTVHVVDGNGGVATQAISVTVTNVNEDPVISSAATASVLENQINVLTVTSSDVDGGTPTYSISGGVDAALFAIDGSSGELAFLAAPDFESPIDAGGDNVFNVIIEADDGLGGTATQAIAVSVTNVNEDPVISSSSVANAAENQTSVLTVTSSDVDGAASIYTISGGADAALFAIDGSSGALTFLAAPDFESPTDVGGDNVYDVTVQVVDGNGGMATQSIAVTVTNANENPMISSAATASVLENQINVLTVTSSDVDGAAPIYTIAGGADAALFAIDGSSGALIFLAAPDFESPTDVGGDNVYDVTVQVVDGNGGMATQAIAINVTNVNEDPVITSASTANAAENQSTVLTVTSSDVDGAVPIYTIAGGVDAALFAIDGSSGALIFLAAPDFESPTDVGGDNVYDVTVQVVDGNGGMATQAIAINVTNVNEDPVITSASTANAAENQSTVLTVTSSDVDGAAPIYTIAGGADAALFAIDGSSGALTFLAAPDHESPTDLGGDNVYDVTVQVADGNGGMATQAISVTVTNVNEDPVISSAATASVLENQINVLTINSSDVDGGAPTYSIAGGADAVLFTIDVSSGDLTFLGAPDHESPTDLSGDNVYDVIVEADDGLGGTATQAIAVTVTNDNENPLISSAATASVSENQTNVLTVTSSDVDGGAPTYSIAGGADAALFAIDGSSGALTFLAAPDFESPTDLGADNVYDVTVLVADGNGGMATQAIAVTVTNINEDPVISSASAANAAENQTTVLTVTSSDADGGAPTYSIAGGVDAALFAIDGSSGALTFVAAPDFESPADVGGDNVYNVVVEADDGLGGTVTQAIAVTVTNVNEDPTITSASATNSAENQTTILTVTSSDVDGGAPTYTIAGGADAALFAIDGSSGALTFQAAPDFESPTDVGGDNVYDVIVEADDGLGGTATQAIAVIVNNVNENPVITSASAIDAAENQTTILTVTSSDVDGGAPTYSIAGGADAALFSIDGSSGALTFDAAPDFESAPDDGGDNVYDVTVQVVDGNSGMATQAIAVTITNANEDPTITSASAINAAENQTTVLTVTSSDVDGGAPTYSIAGGADAAMFAIDGSSGALIFLAAPDHESPIDVGGDNVYNVIVEAGDGLGGTATQAIAVTVINVNEGPVITSASAASVSENQTSVVMVTSSDVDGGAPTYSIVGGVDAALFAIDGSSGELTFLAAPDFESPGDAGTANVYDVTVQVTDGNGAVDMQSIAVTVNSIDEPPQAVTDILAAREDTVLIIDPTLELLVNDHDDGTEGLSLVSFGQPEHGELIQTPDGMLEYRPDADFFGADSFEYTVADTAGNVTSGIVVLNVESVNDAPVLVSSLGGGSDPIPGVIDANAASTGVFTIAENSAIVGQVAAMDVDGDVVGFALAGPDAGLFEIDGSSGVLSSLVPLDFETPQDADGDNRYEVDILVVDGFGEQSRVPLSFTAIDINEAPALIEVDYTVQEGFTGTLAQLTAFDPDVGDQLEFELVTSGIGTSGGGVILLSDGRLSVTGLASGRYELEVQVRDGSGLVSIGSVTLNVESVIAPEPQLGAAIIDVTESEPTTPTVSDKPLQASIIYAPFSVGSEQARIVSAAGFQMDQGTMEVESVSVGSGSGLEVRALESADPVSRPVITLERSLLNTETRVSSSLLNSESLNVPPTPQQLLDLIERIRSSIGDMDEQEQSADQRTTLVVAFGGVAFSIGFASWILSSRILLAAALSTVSLWRPIDPIPVLLGGRRKDDEELEEDEVVSDSENIVADDRDATNGQ